MKPIYSQNRKKKLPLLIAKAINSLPHKSFRFCSPMLLWNHDLPTYYTIICLCSFKSFKPSSLKRLFPPSLSFLSSRRIIHALLSLQVDTTLRFVISLQTCAADDACSHPNIWKNALTPPIFTLQIFQKYSFIKW